MRKAASPASPPRTFHANNLFISILNSKGRLRAVTGRSVSKGTVGNILKTMITKGLLEKSGSLYKALDLDPKILLSRVDLRRVRYPWQILKPRQAEEQERRQYSREVLV